jgi:hypothetical protein
MDPPPPKDSSKTKYYQLKQSYGSLRQDFLKALDDIKSTTNQKSAIKSEIAFLNEKLDSILDSQMFDKTILLAQEEEEKIDEQQAETN